MRQHPEINVRLMHAIYDQPVEFEDIDLAIFRNPQRPA